MPTANEQLRDALVRHALYVQRFYGGLSRETRSKINRLRVRTVRLANGTSSLRGRISRIRAILDETYDLIETDTGLAVLRLALLEKNYQTRALKSVLGETYSPRRGDRLDALTAGLIPNQDSQSINSYIAGSRKRHLTAATAYIRSGGQGITGATRAGRELSAIQRTIFTNTQNAAANAMYRANDDVLDGYQWTSTLDGRTSDICKALDGRVFKTDAVRYPPAHFNCRSTTIPVVKRFSRLPDSVREGAPLPRAAYDGQIPESLDYPKWLVTQPDRVKLQALGSQRRVDLFNEGRLNLTRFSDPGGRYNWRDFVNDSRRP